MIKFVKSAVTCESRRGVLSRKSLYFGVGKHILYFYVPCTVLFIEYFQTALSMFHFFVIDRTQKQTLLDMQQISFAVLSRPSLSQMYNLQRLKMKSNIS